VSPHLLAKASADHSQAMTLLALGQPRDSLPQYRVAVWLRWQAFIPTRPDARRSLSPLSTVPMYDDVMRLFGQ